MIRRILLVMLLSLALPVSVVGQDAAQARSHTVVDGNTLWDLAYQYYGDAFAWPRIWEANRSLLSDPNLILPGQVLVIPGVPGEAAQVTDVQVETQPAAAPAPPPDSPLPGPSDRTVFFSGQDRVGTGVETAVDYGDLHWVTPDLYQRTGWIDPTRQKTPEAIGQIMDFEAGENIRSGRDAIHPYDRVHIRPMGGGDMPAIGDQVLAFRARQRIRDVGLVTEPTGIFTVVGHTDSTYVAELSRELDQGYLEEWVAPLEELPIEREARPEILLEGDMEATVIAFQVPNQLNSRGSILHLDKGAADGVSTGDVFELRIGGGEGWSGKVAGRLIVHRVRENTASARVMQVTNPVFFEGTVVERVARMN
jgi:hypothetical protein